MHFHGSILNETGVRRASGTTSKSYMSSELRVVLDGMEAEAPYAKYGVNTQLVQQDGVTFLVLNMRKDDKNWQLFRVPIDELWQDEAGPRVGLFDHLGKAIMLA